MVNPLDFETIISYVIGDATIFIYIFAIVLSAYAAKLRMPSSAYFLLMFIFVMMMYFSTGWTGAIIIFIIAAIFLGWRISKFIKQ